MNTKPLTHRALASCFFILVLVGTNAHGSVLRGWYKFDDANNLVVDSSGKGNNGTLFNDGILPTYSSSGMGSGGSAYFGGTFNSQNFNFNGGGGRIDVPINTSAGAMSNMSWGAWVDPLQFDHGRFILSNDLYNGNRFIGIDDRVSDNYAAAIANQNPRLFDTGVDPSSGSWIFIGGVYENDYSSQGVGRLTMFLGNQVFSNIETKFGSNGSSFTSIGGNAGGERYWNGYIDNVFIVEGALTTSQMNLIKNNPTRISEIVANGAIPEPSAALLGGLGILALLRRRRN